VIGRTSRWVTLDVVPKNLALSLRMQTNIPFDKIDEQVRERYQYSFMSNTKWRKLLNTIGDLFPSGFALRFRLIHGNEVRDAEQVGAHQSDTGLEFRIGIRDIARKLQSVSLILLLRQ